jgi:ABC-type phosphate transport system permease subunit
MTAFINTAILYLIVFIIVIAISFIFGVAIHFYKKDIEEINRFKFIEKLAKEQDNKDKK